MKDFDREAYVSQLEDEQYRLISRVRIAEQNFRHLQNKLAELTQAEERLAAIKAILHDALDKLEALQ